MQKVISISLKWDQVDPQGRIGKDLSYQNWAVASLGRAKVFTKSSDAERTSRSRNGLALVAFVIFIFGEAKTLRHGGDQADEERGENELRLHFDWQSK